MESDLLSEIKTVCKAVSPKLLDSNHFVVAMDAISSWMKLPAFLGGLVYLYLPLRDWASVQIRVRENERR